MPLGLDKRSGQRDLVDDTLRVLGAVESIGKPLLFSHDVGPHRFCLISDFEDLSLSFTVSKESTIFVSVDLLGNVQQQLLIVLEMGWELDNQLPHTVQVLNKDRRPLVFFVVSVENTESEVELVAKSDPILVD